MIACDAHMIASQRANVGGITPTQAKAGTVEAIAVYLQLVRGVPIWIVLARIESKSVPHRPDKGVWIIALAIDVATIGE
jgi:hypothetical protein